MSRAKESEQNSNRSDSEQEEKQAREQSAPTKAQIKETHQQELQAELARIETKYAWTVPNNKDRFGRTRDDKETIARRSRKDQFTREHGGFDHHQVKAQEIALASGINRAHYEMEKKALAHDAAKKEEIEGIAAEMVTLSTERQRSVDRHIDQNNKEYLKDLKIITCYPEEKLQTEGAKAVQKVMKTFYDSIEALQKQYAQEVVATMHDGRLKALEHDYESKTAIAQVDHAIQVDALRKKYPQGAVESDRDAASAVQLQKEEPRRSEKDPSERSSQEGASVMSPAGERPAVSLLRNKAHSASDLSQRGSLNLGIEVAFPVSSKVSRGLTLSRSKRAPSSVWKEVGKRQHPQGAVESDRDAASAVQLPKGEPHRREEDLLERSSQEGAARDESGVRSPAGGKSAVSPLRNNAHSASDSLQRGSLNLRIEVPPVLGDVSRGSNSSSLRPLSILGDDSLSEYSSSSNQATPSRNRNEASFVQKEVVRKQQNSQAGSKIER